MLIPHEDKVDSIFPNQHIVLLCHNHESGRTLGLGTTWFISILVKVGIAQRAKVS